MFVCLCVGWGWSCERDILSSQIWQQRRENEFMAVGHNTSSNKVRIGVVARKISLRKTERGGQNHTYRICYLHDQNFQSFLTCGTKLKAHAHAPTYTHTHTDTHTQNTNHCSKQASKQASKHSKKTGCACGGGTV